MTPTKHPLCNDILRAPIGDENCEDLHIRREDGAVWSFWKPTPEELAALVLGGTVALHVAGPTHPPLSIHATTATEERPSALTPEETAAISNAIRGRHAALISLTKRIVAEWVRTTTETPDRRRLVDEFLDLVTLNHTSGEIVRSVPVDQPAEPAVTQADVDRYRSDAEGWKEEAERWRKLAEKANDYKLAAQGAEDALTKISKALDPEGVSMSLVDEAASLKAKADRADRLQAAVDSVIDQLNRASVENPNHAES